MEAEEEKGEVSETEDQSRKEEDDSFIVPLARGIVVGGDDHFDFIGIDGERKV